MAGKNYTTEPNWLQEKANTIKKSSIHDRFRNLESYRESQMPIGWTEETVDAIAAKDHSYVATPAERKRYDNT